MERSAWLQEKRRMAEVRMDTLFAANYDEGWGISIPRITVSCFRFVLTYTHK